MLKYTQSPNEGAKRVQGFLLFNTLAQTGKET
jgi:hypothetical protein